ncbi:sulfite exporter TauE/SafE family protein [Lacibacter sp.]|uniref:sulfite exporter TauE/SafE family protein n=1 Tax=Lacibacter sp. TaxID=1915409 RepID=UPI002B4AD82D|nr:sulfite exporter TauE/SafE family protein [Lacibacter sp.]HLP35787.1 sulfite exporter TauE/SafE family protein [Lacibacter sp.]
MDFIYLFYILLFLVAFLYASVGHGGASGYLALMAIFSIAPDVMKPTALLLNLFVSLTSFIQFYRGGYFKWNLFWPFALLAAPMAYFGGKIEVDAFVYKKILGLLLLIPVVRFFFFSNIQVNELKKVNTGLAVAIGGAIGFLSGLIGIGGGIILSPVLFMLKWANMKQAAAVSALFIFVNSLTGLWGQMEKGIHFTSDMYLYVIIAFAGGLAGAYYGSVKFNQKILKNVLALVLLVAVYKLLLTNA